eukprot:GHRQ01031976.1.p2 GENE.GHRQ01031976.1~~GHRQ01031976.1.p2  ORF type:complete len:118 (+),score=27.12 GHRQ01031976.1:413-766(+)
MFTGTELHLFVTPPYFDPRLPLQPDQPQLEFAVNSREVTSTAEWQQVSRGHRRGTAAAAGWTQTEAMHLHLQTRHAATLTQMTSSACTSTCSNEARLLWLLLLCICTAHCRSAMAFE